MQRLKQNHIAVTMDTRVEAALSDVFDFVATEDVLPKVLTGYAMTPV
jgi:hypothetical protein